MALRLNNPSCCRPFVAPFLSLNSTSWKRSCSVRSQMNTKDSHKLVLEVKEKLEKDHHSLPVGKCGRDDEEMILWFLKDRKFSVNETVSKLTKAIKWRREFGVAELSEDSVRAAAKTGKSYLHDFLDVYKRPVMMVDASKHIPGMQESIEDEKLCVYLIEKALSRLPEGRNDILTIIDLRGFGTKNADLKFVTFLFDVFYYYYPKRLGQVLFVEAPFVFKPIWQLVKPMLKSYAYLVRFCSVEEVRKEYFTEATIPASFRR